MKYRYLSTQGPQLAPGLKRLSSFRLGDPDCLWIRGHGQATPQEDLVGLCVAARILPLTDGSATRPSKGAVPEVARVSPTAPR